MSWRSLTYCKSCCEEVDVHTDRQVIRSAEHERARLYDEASLPFVEEFQAPGGVSIGEDY